MLTHFVRSHLSSKLPALAWALPSLALMTCAHSLRSFALIIKAPFSRSKLTSFALIAPKGCSIVLYCELQVCITAKAVIQLSLAWLCRSIKLFIPIVQSYCSILLFIKLVSKKKVVIYYTSRAQVPWGVVHYYY